MTEVEEKEAKTIGHVSCLRRENAWPYKRIRKNNNRLYTKGSRAMSVKSFRR